VGTSGKNGDTKQEKLMNQELNAYKRIFDKTGSKYIPVGTVTPQVLESSAVLAEVQLGSGRVYIQSIFTAKAMGAEYICYDTNSYTGDNSRYVYLPEMVEWLAAMGCTGRDIVVYGRQARRRAFRKDDDDQREYV
jgi:hypothetical protein